ncbi:MAG TPA: tol-pal system protein YbgF [Myxococcales bacterium]|nr:tol-pal system protein YbgF [Myxococcales bacterium]
MKVRVADPGKRAMNKGKSGQGVRWIGPLHALLIGFSCLLVGQGCVTQGDFRKLEERVLDDDQRSKDRPNPFKQIAQLSAQVDALRGEQAKLAGQLEVAEKKADQALKEARRARRQLAAQSGEAAASDAAAEEAAEEEFSTDDAGVTSEELAAYQKALEAWRGDDHKLCIDRFRKFLQTYPASPHADDGAYWMADCHFKQGDYRVAVLRFNDVVRVYPTGNKAADALFRQGESLLKLGPGFHDAARTVFEQVIKDYPDSARAKQAQKQLSALGTG